MNFFDAVQINTEITETEIFLTVIIRNQTILAREKIGQIRKEKFKDENGRELFEFEAWLGEDTIGLDIRIWEQSRKEIENLIHAALKHEINNYLVNLFMIYHDDKRDGLYVLNE